MPRAKRWEPPKNYNGNPHNLMPPIRQEFENLQPNEVISDDRQHAHETAMCITTLIFDDIVQPYMLDRVRWQFGAKQDSPKNPLVVGKSANKQGDSEIGEQ
ncbi:hypothetical protein AMTR_s00065p00180680 [Amborella trichopoda]|uniref:Uncharacterized protein n=1 Tax=Amborella trichopoda TaxID=13333 RepID=U5D854_AMBTC|nr:hypothetical protein AMTR_s00065p00180680 [Amborella trichopoda]